VDVDLEAATRKRGQASDKAVGNGGLWDASNPEWPARGCDPLEDGVTTGLAKG
jgi:hypothetical protein